MTDDTAPEAPETFDWAIHFGIYPSPGGLMVNGYKDNTVERELVLPPALEMKGDLAVVSGSWKCWGPADQGTDGDQSLHVVVRTRALGTAGDDEGHLQSIFDALTAMPGTHGRWMDYALISTDHDWSDMRYAVMFKNVHPIITEYMTVSKVD